MKTVIFDFDGTIADTFVTAVRIYERLAKQTAPYTDDEIQRLRGLHALELIRELRIRPWRIPWLLVRGRALMRREMAVVKLFVGVEEVLKGLQAQGTPIYIMSSNSPSNIRRFLKRLGMDKYFIRIYGNVSILGKTKMLRRVIARNRLDPANTVYIGDEGRDIEAARRAGLQSIAVAWGYNNAELLASHRPDYLVTSPEELGRLLAEKTTEQ